MSFGPARQSPPRHAVEQLPPQQYSQQYYAEAQPQQYAPPPPQHVAPSYGYAPPPQPRAPPGERVYRPVGPYEMPVPQPAPEYQEQKPVIPETDCWGTPLSCMPEHLRYNIQNGMGGSPARGQGGQLVPYQGPQGTRRRDEVDPIMPYNDPRGRNDPFEEVPLQVDMRSYFKYQDLREIQEAERRPMPQHRPTYRIDREAYPDIDMTTYNKYRRDDNIYDEWRPPAGTPGGPPRKAPSRSLKNIGPNMKRWFTPS